MLPVRFTCVPADLWAVLSSPSKAGIKERASLNSVEVSTCQTNINTYQIRPWLLYKTIEVFQNLPGSVNPVQVKLWDWALFAHNFVCLRHKE